MQQGSFLNNQAVDGQMLWSELNRPLQGLPPGLKRLTRKTEDEVEVQVVKSCSARPGDAFLRFLASVDSAQQRQFRIRKRLYAEAQACNPCRMKIPQPLWAQGTWVGFQADFCMLCEAKRALYLSQKRLHHCWFHQGRRPAAKIDGFRWQNSPARHLSKQSNLLLSRVSINGQQIQLASIRDKIAVITSPRAKRHVDIDTEHASILTVIHRCFCLTCRF